MSHIVQRATLQLLRAYKWAISPMFAPACRYVPTCSEYAMEAVERYGALRGGLMAAGRLLRCHPFAHGGYDPVAHGGHDPSVKRDLEAPWKSGPLRPALSGVEEAASEVQNSPGFSPSGRS